MKFELKVSLYLEPTDEAKRPLSSEDAKELVRVALQCLRNDGYENDSVAFESFAIEDAS